MAAGLGFKTFTTGEVLNAADTNGYLMQGVLVFADAAARDAAITAPAEGQFAYLKDTDVTTYYTSSAWANLDTTGMANPMTTTADIIYSSSGSTPARLGIGSTGQVLTVAGGVPTWATAGASSYAKIVSAAFSASAAVAVNGCFTSAYSDYVVIIGNVSSASGTNLLQFQYQTGTSTVYSGDYRSSGIYSNCQGTTDNLNFNGGSYQKMGPTSTYANSKFVLNIGNVGNSSQYPTITINGSIATTTNLAGYSTAGGTTGAADTYTGFYLSAPATISGSYAVYGLEK